MFDFFASRIAFADSLVERLKGKKKRLRSLSLKRAEKELELQCFGERLSNWPERLTSIPPRISSGSLKGITAEMFNENTELWKKRVPYYKTLDYQLAETRRFRNLLDMNAYLGGFAAAMIDEPVWVMNVVLVEAEINTLGVVGGLIGTYQNCVAS
ncbi:S-adenosyl-L-methionine-dependent methyltransferase superfamily protein [Trifolium repens]|nr:S-adenosyl-L-methionine-dependent methyltransferase superfamily protein [Trifolium repens]